MVKHRIIGFLTAPIRAAQTLAEPIGNLPDQKPLCHVNSPMADTVLQPTTSNKFQRIGHYALALIVPPAAVWWADGFTIRLLLCALATTILSVPCMPFNIHLVLKHVSLLYLDASYLIITRSFTLLLIFANACLILPGKISPTDCISTLYRIHLCHLGDSRPLLFRGGFDSQPNVNRSASPM